MSHVSNFVEDEIEYLLHREQQERARALAAQDECARDIHLRMAVRYAAGAKHLASLNEGGFSAAPSPGETAGHASNRIRLDLAR